MTADIKFSWFEKNITKPKKLKAVHKKYLNKIQKGKLIIAYTKSLNIPFDDATWLVFIKKMWLYELNGRRLREFLNHIKYHNSSDALNKLKKEWYSEGSLTKDNYPEKEYLYTLNVFKQYGWLYFYVNKNSLKKYITI